uniref:Uncharacterized protein n=1 Tax=Pristionchus pacificus TaxID=54126 RepID=A0A2A6BRR8_PRIPA|eukprot:PDM68629.1 hypothetical protein PRIPAC_46931 [Pristionchus pacificus]
MPLQARGRGDAFTLRSQFLDPSRENFTVLNLGYAFRNSTCLQSLQTQGMFGLLPSISDTSCVFGTRAKLKNEEFAVDFIKNHTAMR